MLLNAIDVAIGETKGRTEVPPGGHEWKNCCSCSFSCGSRYPATHPRRRGPATTFSHVFADCVAWKPS